MRTRLKSRLDSRLDLARVAVGVVALAGIVTGCGRAPELPVPRGVLLISLDTLRADHLGAYGYRRDTTPFLDELARRGVLFERAYSHYPGTLTSHMTMLTGLYPEEHDVYVPDGVLSPQISTLPELLAAAGVHTAGYTEGGQMRGEYGFERGFQLFHDRPRRTGRGAGRQDSALEATLDRGLRFLESLSGDERFFLFLHTYAPHSPYAPAPAYERLFDAHRRPPGAPRPSSAFLHRYNGELPELPAGTVEWFRSRYDATLRYVDDRLREFFTRLEEDGRLDDVVVIVTSDHGEEFLEHGRLAHAQVYEETLRVPLIVVVPGDKIGELRTEGLVGLVDLTPTILDLLEVKADRRLSGRSLEPRILGRSRARLGTHFASYYEGAIRSLHLQGAGALWHLVWHRYGGWTEQGRRLELDLPPDASDLRLRSVGRARQVRLLADGEPFSSRRLPTTWTSLELPAAATWRLRLAITSDSCEWEEEPGAGLCRAIEVKGERLQRRELFDLGADPREQDDLSARERHRVAAMTARLEDFEPEPRAPAGSLDADPERTQQLRALGYLE